MARRKPLLEAAKQFDSKQFVETVKFVKIFHSVFYL
jgi:hypothetical protein